MHGLKVMTKSISALFHPSFCPILQQKSTPRTHFKAKLSDSNGKLCIFTFSTATCFQNFILMKKRCCCSKTLKSVLICPKCWKVRICLKNPSEMPLKIDFFQILSASYSISHILRKPRSSEFFIYAPISCNTCAKTAFWKKLQKKQEQAATAIAAETATFRSCYWIDKKMNMLLQETNKIYCCKLLLIP